MSERYCSQCHWSTNDHDRFPPRWYCLVNGRKLIVRDEDVCKDWVKLDVNVNQSTIQEEQKCTNA